MFDAPLKVSHHSPSTPYGRTLLVDLLGVHRQVMEWTPFKPALRMATRAERGLVNRWYIERDSTVEMELMLWLRRVIRSSNKEIKPWESSRM